MSHECGDVEFADMSASAATPCLCKDVEDLNRNAANDRWIPCCPCSGRDMLKGGGGGEQAARSKLVIDVEDLSSGH
jgi:hypothetical protein